MQPFPMWLAFVAMLPLAATAPTARHATFGKPGGTPDSAQPTDPLECAAAVEEAIIDWGEAYIQAPYPGAWKNLTYLEQKAWLEETPPPELTYSKLPGDVKSLCEKMDTSGVPGALQALLDKLLPIPFGREGNELFLAGKLPPNLNLRFGTSELHAACMPQPCKRFRGWWELQALFGFGTQDDSCPIYNLEGYIWDGEHPELDQITPDSIAGIKLGSTIDSFGGCYFPYPDFKTMPLVEEYYGEELAASMLDNGIELFRGRRSIQIQLSRLFNTRQALGNFVNDLLAPLFAI